MKHTPTETPWKLSQSHATQNVNDPMFWHKDVVKGGIRVARCAGVGKENAEANAEFIVHAVNMHESLVEALKKVHTSMLDGSITDTGFDTTFITTLLSQAERK